MDLLETTLKVVENRTAARESLTLYKKNLEQYEQYIAQLKDNLQETQLINSQTTEILEINNITKNTYNKKSKEVKDFCAKTFDYTQQLEQHLSLLFQNEKSLDDQYNDTAQDCKRVETRYENVLKHLEIVETDLNETLLKQTSKIEQEISATVTKHKEYDEMWKNVIDEHDEKHRMLQSIKLELEILQDNTEMEESIILEKTNDGHKIFEEICSDMEVKDKILDVEQNLIVITENLKQVLENKHMILMKQNQHQQVLKELEKECKDLETTIKETDDSNLRRIESLTYEMELKKKLIEENESKLSTCQMKMDGINNDINQICSKISGLDEELEYYQNCADNSKEMETNNIEKVTKDHENLVKQSEALLIEIANCETDIHTKQDELQEIKSKPNLELLEIQAQIQLLAANSLKKNEAEKEIEEIDTQNKNLQHNVEQCQTMLKDINFKKLQMVTDREQNQEEVKNLTMQCENIEKEIRRLETSQQEKIKLFPTPPLKHRGNAPQPKPKPKPQPKQKPQVKPHPTRKRAPVLDFESDSSVDGERLSYTEFMAKKRALKENKK